MRADDRKAHAFHKLGGRTTSPAPITPENSERQALGLGRRAKFRKSAGHERESRRRTHGTEARRQLQEAASPGRIGGMEPCSCWSGDSILEALAKTFAIEFTDCFRRQEALRRYFFRPSISRMLAKALAERSPPWCPTPTSPRVYFRGKMTRSGSGSERTAAMRTRKRIFALLAVLFTASGLPMVVGAQTIPNGAAIDAKLARS